MRFCRVLLIVSTIILCLGIVSVCVCASSSESPDYSLPIAEPPAADGDSYDGSISDSENNDFPLLSVSGEQQTQAAETDPTFDDESNAEAADVTEPTEVITSNFEEQIETTNAQPGSREPTQTKPEELTDPAGAEVTHGNEAETESDDGLHFRIVKIAENQEEIVTDYSAWEFVILFAVWLLVTIILFVGAILVVQRLMRR